MNIPKFRAWLKDVGLMKNVVSIHFEDKEVYFGEIDEIGDDPLFDLDDVILMQSTGLTDKNGVEIFCDDVVKVGNEELFAILHLDKTATYAMQGLRTGKIRWFESTYQRKSEFMINEKELEVIGSVHANKELLND